jgi:hypothetical protein
MERFIRREMVRHYRRMLRTITDERQRVILEGLLLEARLKQIAAGDPPDD